MKYFNAKAGTKPENKHDKIAGKIAKAVYDGIYCGQLPSVAVLAEKFEANPLTIRKALNSLEEAGLIEKRERVGTFVKHLKRLAVISNQPPEKRVEHSLNTNTIYAPLLKGIESEAMRQNYSLIQLVYSHDKTFETKLKNEVDGCICQTECPAIKGLPMIQVMGLPNHNDMPQITYDNSVVGTMAAEYLIERDCRRFIYFGHADSPLFAERMGAFKRKVEAAGKEFIHIYADIVTMNAGEIFEAAKKRLNEIFKNKSLRTGIHISADIFAVAVYQALYGTGLEPVNDVPVISCNNNPQLLHGLHPCPPSIDVRMTEIGEQSVKALLKILSGDTKTPLESIILTPVIKP